MREEKRKNGEEETEKKKKEMHGKFREKGKEWERKIERQTE